MDAPSSSVAKTPKPLKGHVQHPVIEIVDATKQFGYFCHWQTVLRKFSMTVNSGEVYVLLGPHGCGKTTVLNTILGLVTLNLGDVKVFGFKPGHILSGIPGIRVGYTPQSNGLYTELTVTEILRFYGALLNLNRLYVIQRITFLSNLLALPSGKHYIKYCTEGSKRQISFAVALLHEPELLILDEPCDGIDPLLRLDLWEHMKQLVQQGKTILVTTQNCEEAQMADRIGFMKKGTLLIEGNLHELLTIHNERYLGNLYRRVYSLNYIRMKSSPSIQENPLINLEPLRFTSSEGFMYNENEGGTDETTPAAPYRSDGRNRTRSIDEGFTSSFRFPNVKRLGALILCDCARSIRNYPLLLLFLLMPSVFLTVFCLTIGTTPSSLKLAVVNLEATETACIKNRHVFLSCQILNLIDKNIVIQVHYKNVKEAWMAAKNLEVSGVFIIERHLSNFINNNYAQIILGKGKEPPETPPMTLSLDMTSRIVSNTLEAAVKDGLETYIKRAASGTQVEGVGSGYPLRLGPPVYGDQHIIDTYYMAPGLIMVFAYHLVASLVAVTIVTDRDNKLDQRNYLAGVQLLETMLSQLIVYGIISMVQTTFLFVVLLKIFNMPNNGSLSTIALLMFLQIWCGISFGTLVAMISSSSVNAGVCVFCFTIGTLVLCGIQWPLYGLPNEVLEVIRFLPQTQSIRAVCSVLLRGTLISHVHVWLGIVIPLCWFALFIIGCCLINKII